MRNNTLPFRTASTNTAGHEAERHLPRLYRAMAVALARRAESAALVLAGATEDAITSAADRQIAALLDVLTEAERHRQMMAVRQPAEER